MTKLPEPVGYQWLNTAHYRRKLPIGAHVNEFQKLFTEAQVKGLLAQADKDFSDGMTVVHLQVADQMKKRYEPVLKLALEALSTCSGVPHWPAIEQVKDSVRKVLAGGNDDAIDTLQRPHAMGKSNTMPCPQCGAWTDIVDSRAPEPHIRRRRYECANGHRFVTISTEVFMGFLENSNETVDRSDKTRDRQR